MSKILQRFFTATFSMNRGAHIPQPITHPELFDLHKQQDLDDFLHENNPHPHAMVETQYGLSIVAKITHASHHPHTHQPNFPLNLSKDQPQAYVNARYRINIPRELTQN